MELLQKLTLYDLFGYTLPGVLAVCLYKYDDALVQMEDISVGGLCMLIILGYVVGAMMTEIAERLEWVGSKILCRNSFLKAHIYEKFWKDICKNYGLSEDMVRRALENAEVTGCNQNAGADVLIKDYTAYMYSAIQAAPEFDRLDNYASAELLYKNMFLVSLLAVYISYKNQQTVSIQMVISMIGAVCFAVRRIHFAERSRGYTICWFVQKYGKNN